MFFVADRLLILASGLPIVFDINEAEYAHYRVISSYWDSEFSYLFASGWQHFLQDCRSIGNQPHGSLGYSALFLLLFSKLFSLPMASWVLKAAALFHSTGAFLGWLILLTREQISTFGLCCFVLLAICAPVAPLKISILYWGTHDIAIFILPWLLLGFQKMHRTSPSTRICIVIGVCTAICAVLQLSLMLSILCCLSYSCLHLLKQRQWKALLGLNISFLLCWQLLLLSPLLTGLNLPNPLFLGTDVSFSSPQNLQSSGTKTIFWWNSQTSLERIFLPFIFAGGVLVSTVLNRSTRSFSTLLAFLCIVGPLGVLLLSAILTVFNQPPIGLTPRYLALYYLPMIALFSLTASQSKGISVGLLGLSLWALSTHSAWINPHYTSAWKNYDGVALYFHSRQENIPQKKGILYADKSADFLNGYAFLQSFQFRSYWQFWYPQQYPILPVKRQLTEHVQNPKNTITNRNDFIEGTMKAFQIVIPENEQQRRQSILEQIEL